MENLEKRFDSHILTTIINTEKFKVFEFRRENGSVNLYQRWIIDRGTLIVLGDCHNSIYKWNDSQITLAFLAKCNLDYFSSKCIADKDGSDQKVYDADDASIKLKEIASDHILENYDEFVDINWVDMDGESRFKLITPIIEQALDISDIDSLFYNETIQDAYAFLVKSEHEFMFGCDGWEYCNGLMQLTNVPKMHLSALRVANKKYPNIF